MFFMKVVLKIKILPRKLGSCEPRFGHLIQLFNPYPANVENMVSS